MVSRLPGWSFLVKNSCNYDRFEPIVYSSLLNALSIPNCYVNPNMYKNRYVMAYTVKYRQFEILKRTENFFFLSDFTTEQSSFFYKSFFIEA